MKEFTIGKSDAGQRLDRWLAKALPLLPAPPAQKYIRLKRVKVNGKDSQRDVQLQLGDILQLYINDKFFEQPREENAFLSVFKPHLNIVYENENLILLNERPSLLYHADGHERVSTLITHIQAYLYQKKEWNPRDEHPFTPTLCNRIDHSTDGIVMAAENAETLRILNQKVRNREIAKFYLAIVHGRMRPSQGKLEGFLLKGEDRTQVKVFSRPVPDGKSATTLYKTLRTAGGPSLVECELSTGHTRQTRARFAATDHPLLRDGKHGRERDNKRYGRSFQALYSYKPAFTLPTDTGLLEYLRGHASTVEQVDFVAEYFPAGERV